MRAREGTSMPQKPAARNVSIELLRIVAMFLILTCHFVIHFDWDHHQLRVVLPQEPGWWSALRFVIVQYGQVGVSIFFIISGYFLVEKSFKWNRLVKTWLQMFCYSVAFLIIVLLLGAFHHYPMAVEPIMHGWICIGRYWPVYSRSSTTVTGSLVRTC